jgi:hypothetical protein
MTNSINSFFDILAGNGRSAARELREQGQPTLGAAPLRIAGRSPFFCFFCLLLDSRSRVARRGPKPV